MATVANDASPQVSAPSAIAAEAERVAHTRLLLQAVDSYFVSGDTDHSGTLDRNELAALANDSHQPSVVQEGASMLLPHFDDARHWKDSANETQFHADNTEGTMQFYKMFSGERNNEGISPGDLQSMLSITSAEDVSKLLVDLRARERHAGWVAAGHTVEFGVFGAALGSINKYAGGVFLGVSGLCMYESYFNFRSQDTAHLGAFIDDRRSQLLSWTQ